MERRRTPFFNANKSAAPPFEGTALSGTTRVLGAFLKMLEIPDLRLRF